MPASRIPTISSEVATGRRMNVRDGLTGLPPCCSLRWLDVRRSLRVPHSPPLASLAPVAPTVFTFTLLPSCNLSTPVITTLSPGASPEVISV